jgi:hypothetical protein
MDNLQNKLCIWGWLLFEAIERPIYIVTNIKFHINIKS